MKITNAIILAGGKGTRLKSVVDDIPKPMAPINDIPFLHILLDYLYNAGMQNINIAVGYKKEIIMNYFGNAYRGMKISYTIEDKPLGTGGAILKSSRVFKGNPFFVFNGDTLFFADLWEMEKEFLSHDSDLVMAIKPMKNFDRYGTVTINDENIITTFNEKKYCENGNINGGIYLMDNSLFLIDDFKETFSFEKEVFENNFNKLKIKGIKLDSYFIDIGIPSDYFKAEKDFKLIKIKELAKKIKTEKDWTLFLDRDGVINKRIPGNYVKFTDEFKFMDNALEAIKTFSQFFKTIVVVTNQQGVGKRLMNIQRIHEVHDYMTSEINKIGGRIDKVYYCPELAKLNPKCRKPNIGMALEALKDFPEINFNKSIMVGDSISDIQFGNRLNMKTVFLETKNEEEIINAKKENIDFQYKDLFEFSKYLH